jgi:hypothetical protein
MREAKLPLEAVGERVKCRRRWHKLAQTITGADHFRVCERWKSKIIYEKWESSLWTDLRGLRGYDIPHVEDFFCYQEFLTMISESPETFEPDLVVR